jgi:hypothetical protein
MKPLNALLIVVLVFIFSSNMINQARADALDDFLSEPSPKSDFTSFYKEDGSLVNVYGAEEAGIAIKNGEVEYFVIPKDDGSPTFIYDDELIVCTSTGCY